MSRIRSELVLAVALTARLVAAEPAPEPNGAHTMVDEAPSARAWLDAGVEARKRGDDRRALEAFESALGLERSAEALAQVALAEQALGRWLDAREHLEQALAETADPWIVNHGEVLRAALGEIVSRLGQLELSCNVNGAEIRVDGRLLGRTPLRSGLWLVAGLSVVQLSAPGYFEIARQVKVDAGGLSRLDVQLIPQAPAHDGALAAGAPARAGPASTAPQRERGTSARSVALYTSFGLAALGVTVGATGVVLREVNVRLYNDDRRCSRQLGVRRSDECPDEAAAWRLGEALAIGGFIAAGVFGAAGLYFTLDAPGPRGAGAVRCSLGVVAAECAGRF